MFSRWFGSGWKLKLGSALMVLPGVVDVIGNAINGHAAISEKHAAMIAVAFSLLGIGHKIEKAGKPPA